MKRITLMFGMLVFAVGATYTPNVEAVCTNTIDAPSQTDGVEMGCGIHVYPKVKIKAADPKNVDPMDGDYQTHIYDRATIESGTEIGAFSQIGSDCQIGKDVRIGKSVVLGEGCNLPDKTQVGNGTIIGGHLTGYGESMSYRFGNDLIISPNTDMGPFPEDINDHAFYETTVSFGMISLFWHEAGAPTDEDGTPPSKPRVSGAETGSGSAWEVTPNVWLLSAFPHDCDEEGEECDSATLTYDIGSGVQGTTFTIVVHETNGLVGHLGCELVMKDDLEAINSTGTALLPFGRHEYVLRFPGRNNTGATLTCKLETSDGGGESGPL